MFLVFFALWVIFNGRLTVEIALLGIFISIALYGFCWKFLGFSPHREWRAVCCLPKITAYIALLIVDIIKANLQLTRIVLGKKKEIHPQLVTFRTPLQTRVGRITLADSITLTPGTITAFLKEDEVTVHCLDQSFAKGIENLDFQQRLLDIEKGVKRHDA